MKASLHSLAGALAAAICGILLSCTKEIEETARKDFMRIGVMEYRIVSAGVYCDATHDGLDIVLTSSPCGFSLPLETVPDGVVLCLDIPLSLLDGGIKSLHDAKDSESWAFCICEYSFGRSSCIQRLDEIVVGSLQGTCSEGRLTLEMNVLTEDGEAIACRYDGVPETAREYIWRWDR